MIKLKPNMKVKIDREEKRLLLIIAAAVAVTVFCLTATKVMLANGSYKRHVISARHEAVNQLKTNLAQSKALIDHYGVFEGAGNPSNIIGGQNTKDQLAVPPNGNNSRIVLDALPSSYDFPALITSMTKILSDSGITNPNIGGSDQSDTINANADANAAPQAIAIPLTISGSGDFGRVQQLLKDLERSIRPIDVSNLQLQGSAADFTVGTTMNTYYQPPKSLNIVYKGVK
jgi:hypothetical protein